MIEGDDEARGGEEDARPVFGHRRAAWWAWPLIVISIVFVAWGVNFFQPGVDTRLEEPSPRVASAADLAMLKIQAQIVIASSELDPAAARQTLEELRRMARDPRSTSALALLENFVDSEEFDPGSVLEQRSVEEAGQVRELTEKAIDEGIGEKERETLRSHLGWFAELAPGPEGGEPPKADSIRRKAIAILAIGGVGILLGLCALIAGAVLLCIHVHRWTRGDDVNQLRPGDEPMGILLECFALYLGLMVLGEVGAILLGPVFQVAGYGASVTVPLLWPLVRGERWREFRRAIGFHRGSGFWREVGAGFVGYLGVISIASIGIFLTLILTFLLGFFAGEAGETAGAAPVAPQTHPIVGWIYEGDFRARILCLLLAAGFAPLFEEIFFRGALHRYLRGRFRFFGAALVTALIFAALHPQGVVGIPALAAIGVGFSLLREWRDSLIAPMVAHALNNGILVGALCLVL